MGILDKLMRVPVIKSAVESTRKWYKGSVTAELQKYGLRYDDLLSEYDPEVKKVLEQLPPWELELRMKRLKRAMDLDVKKTYLDPEIAAKEDVWDPYIRSRLQVLKNERVERQIADQ